MEWWKKKTVDRRQKNAKDRTAGVLRAGVKPAPTKAGKKTGRHC